MRLWSAGVRGDTLLLSGIDLINGTPVLDVKPYVPFADSVQDARVAPWLQELPTPDLEVQFRPAAEAQLEQAVPSLRLFADAAQARQALCEVLAGDPRSVHWRQKRANEEYGFSIDTLNVIATFSEGVATVERVEAIVGAESGGEVAGRRKRDKAPAPGGKGEDGTEGGVPPACLVSLPLPAVDA